MLGVVDCPSTFVGCQSAAVLNIVRLTPPSSSMTYMLLAIWDNSSRMRAINCSPDWRAVGAASCRESGYRREGCFKTPSKRFVAPLSRFRHLELPLHTYPIRGFTAARRMTDAHSRSCLSISPASHFTFCGVGGSCCLVVSATCITSQHGGKTELPRSPPRFVAD